MLRNDPLGCGEGQLSDFEECDDGDELPGDGCSASCQVRRRGGGEEK